MARITYPDDFAGQQSLFTAILAQHAKLGAKSPLAAFAKQQNMDFIKLQAAVEPALAQDKLSKSLKRSREMDTQQRNLKFGAAWKHLLGEVHFLTGFYKGIERELGEWGVPVAGGGRIVYPTSFAEQAKLMQVFLAKHNSYDPGESPLQLYVDEHEIDVAADLLAVADAVKNEANKNEEDGEGMLATQTRNKLWAPVAKAMRLIGNFLMGLYGEDSRKVAVWGFAVAETAAGTREQASRLDPLQERMQKSVVIPGLFVNVGAEDLHVWKGAKKAGEAMVVKPGGQMGMVKGYSVIVVFNPSTMVVGKYTIVIYM